VSSPWADKSYLTGVQYGNDANLAARQSIYAYQRPPIDIVGTVADLIGAEETVADVGCGNGAYLAALAARGHQGHVLGVDMSPGMLAAARQRVSYGLIAADATALPVRDSVADVTLAMHMLYHVPSPADAVRELRRITRPGGRLIVGLNGDDHLVQFRSLATAAIADIGQPEITVWHDRLTLDQGEALLRSVFADVTRHDLVSALQLPGPEPAVAYLRSAIVTGLLTDPEPLIAAFTRRYQNDTGVTSGVTTHSGFLVCA
jgi:SAM-dependent methyltransferase